MPMIDFADLPVAVGQVIAGRYTVSAVLGRGGMGVVLAGRHVELGERVAIKFLNKEHAEHADRFFREARAAARIRSEHVVRIFDVGRLPSGEPYIVMEHLDGEDLADRLHRAGPLKPRAIADVLVNVCQALAEAHAAGIVHRDLKPANIFLARGPGGDDVPKLLDFGVARIVRAYAADAPAGDAAATHTATVAATLTGTITGLAGTPGYLPPEAFERAEPAPAFDIWALTVVLYKG